MGFVCHPSHADEGWAGPFEGLNISHYDYENRGHGNSFDDTSNFALGVWSQTNHKKSDTGVGGGIKAGYNWQLFIRILTDITHI